MCIYNIIILLWYVLSLLYIYSGLLHISELHERILTIFLNLRPTTLHGFHEAKWPWSTHHVPERFSGICFLICDGLAGKQITGFLQFPRKNILFEGVSHYWTINKYIKKWCFLICINILYIVVCVYICIYIDRYSKMMSLFGGKGLLNHWFHQRLWDTPGHSLKHLYPMYLGGDAGIAGCSSISLVFGSHDEIHDPYAT